MYQPKHASTLAIRSRHQSHSVQDSDHGPESSIASPSTLETHPLLQLQRWYGNQHVQQMVQRRSAASPVILAELMLGQVGDRYEKRHKTTLSHPAPTLTQTTAGPAHQIMRTPSDCPNYESGEVEESRQSDGVLSQNVRRRNDSELIIQDFPVNQVTVPEGVTETNLWQRTMSNIIGNPHMAVAIEGFADCQGDTRHNLNLRQRRSDAIVALFPPAVQHRVLFNFSRDQNNYLAPNATRNGRAQNRAVRLTFRAAPPRGQDSCEAIQHAANLDEYLFLVRCMEEKLRLNTSSQATVALSLLRQIYYGNAAWSQSRTWVWNSVIPNRPWSPNTDPRPRLGTTLFNALQNSQIVEGIDLGHLMTGLDAMLSPREVELDFGRFIWVTSLPNEEWATWAGDVGSAVAHFALDTVYGSIGRASEADYYQRFSSDSDMRGNLDAFALRAAATPGGTPSQELMRAWRPRGRLSEVLMQYYRLTQSRLGRRRGGNVRQFVEAYGGIILNNAISNRATLERNLAPSIQEFAGYFFTQEMLRRGDFPAGAPDAVVTMQQAVVQMTRLFVNWLNGNLS